LPVDLPQVDAALGSHVQRAVIGPGIGAPCPLIGQVGRGGSVGHIEQVHQPEDEVGIRTGVGDEHVRPLAAVLVEGDVEHMQGVPGRPRNDLVAQADRLGGRKPSA
jgi:hypothetical protein